MGIQARLLADWVCKDTSGALPPRLTVPASSKRVGTLGPPGTRRHHQLLRAGVPGCPRNGPWPPPRAHFLRSLARSLARAPAPALRSLAARGSSSLVRRPRPVQLGQSHSGLRVRQESRPYCPDPSAQSPLPGSLCLNPAASIPLSGPCSGIRLLGAFCPDLSLSLDRTA